MNNPVHRKGCRRKEAHEVQQDRSTLFYLDATTAALLMSAAHTGQNRALHANFARVDAVLPVRKVGIQHE